MHDAVDTAYKAPVCCQHGAGRFALSLSLFVYIMCLHFMLAVMAYIRIYQLACMHTYVRMYLPMQIPAELQYNYRATYVPTDLPTHLSTCLPAY